MTSRYQSRYSVTPASLVLELEEGQPVCYASRALTDTETRYAQIEKELSNCDKFDQYLYGRDVITVESDHEPQKAIFKKEIHKSPKRLQSMCLALQKYNLNVEYKKGSLMLIAVTLKTSQAVKVQFARHGIPAFLITDNGPEFARREFQELAKA